MHKLERVFSCRAPDAGAGVVGPGPVTHDPAGMLPSLEAMPMCRALVLQRPDQALNPAVLLQAARHDELLNRP